MKPQYRRVLLKISGEALAGPRGFGIDAAVADTLAGEIKEVHGRCVQIGIVLGGGNIFRGLAGAAAGVDRTTGDTVGMLATIINSLLFKESLKRAGVPARVLSALQMDKALEFLTAQRAVASLQAGEVVIMAGGTGNPYFTTDTAAALRCAETNCDVLLKATKVDGIYDDDPATNPAAKKIDTLTHEEALARNIRVMDASAFSLCMDNGIPIVVFQMTHPGNLRRCIDGEPVGSTVRKGA
ncbi:MAG: UMP kinase [Chitinivibrionales bacterium]|nr:UMP kinase [Chitinivibrionales bacterium]MBD3394523.1 UMP kinase [Chitinivibrionales bacterium]